MVLVRVTKDRLKVIYNDKDDTLLFPRNVPREHTKLEQIKLFI